MAKWYIGMTEDAIRQRVVAEAVKYIGVREGTVDHKKIVDTYNSQDKLPRGYRLKDTDAWCAAFVSVLGIILDIPHILLPEVGCGPMIELYKAQGRWMERDDYVPRPGDPIMYDWDAKKGECTGAPDHVGMVVSVKGKTIAVIEGNYENQVKIREVPIEYVKTRGYCLPDYGALVQPFADVDPDAWYAKDVAWAAEHGIVEGVGDGRFEPDRPITRAEVAAMLHRYDNSKNQLDK